MKIGKRQFSEKERRLNILRQIHRKKIAEKISEGEEEPVKRDSFFEPCYNCGKITRMSWGRQYTYCKECRKPIWYESIGSFMSGDAVKLGRGSCIKFVFPYDAGLPWGRIENCTTLYTETVAIKSLLFPTKIVREISNYVVRQMYDKYYQHRLAMDANFPRHFQKDEQW